MPRRRASPPRRTLALVGAGRMGSAMLAGWAGAGGQAFDIAVIDPAPAPQSAAICADGLARLNPPAAAADVVVLAVKPQAFAAAAPEVAAWVGPDTLALSIMAGAPMATIARRLGVRRVARAMPNTPGAIGAGVSAYALGEGAGTEDDALVRALLAPLGPAVGPLPEPHLDLATAVSGSGPAYVFLLVEALEAAGLSVGLDAAAARTLARATVAGAGALLAADPAPPADLRRAVTSPGGTTAAALAVLTAGDALPELVRRAVEAAARRAGELAREADRG
jgi:pyrroline-5-carboxylate reductase